MSDHYLSSPTLNARNQTWSEYVQRSNEPNPQPACQGLVHNGEIFDFERFFAVFKPSSPIYHLVRDMDIPYLQTLMHDALAEDPVIPYRPGSPEHRFVIEARHDLEDKLKNIDNGVKIIQSARLQVQGVRDMIESLRTVNRSRLEDDLARGPATAITSGYCTPPPQAGPSWRGPEPPLQDGYPASSPDCASAVPYWERHHLRQSTEGPPPYSRVPSKLDLGMGDPRENIYNDYMRQEQVYSVQPWGRR